MAALNSDRRLQHRFIQTQQTTSIHHWLHHDILPHALSIHICSIYVLWKFQWTASNNLVMLLLLAILSYHNALHNIKKTLYRMQWFFYAFLWVADLLPWASLTNSHSEKILRKFKSTEMGQYLMVNLVYLNLQLKNVTKITEQMTHRLRICDSSFQNAWTSPNF